MKILDNEFRKSLYKNLVEIGYDKDEAQRIVGVKYFEALKNKITDDSNLIIQSINENKFEELTSLVQQRGEDVEELIKINKFLN